MPFTEAERLRALLRRRRQRPGPYKTANWRRRDNPNKDIPTTPPGQILISDPPRPVPIKQEMQIELSPTQQAAQEPSSEVQEDKTLADRLNELDATTLKRATLLTTRRRNLARRRRLLLEASTGANSAWGESFNSPDTWTLAQTWSDGGSPDLNSLVANHTSARLSSIDFSPDGTHVLTANVSDDQVRAVDLGTAWDFSTGTHVRGNGETNPVACQWKRDGLGYAFYLSSADDIYIRQYDSTEWDVVHPEDSSTNRDDNTMGHTGSGDTAFWMNQDGTAIYISFDKGSGVWWIRRYELPIPYSLTTLGSYTEVNVDATFNTVISSFICSYDETYILASWNNKIYICTMSTPGDASTLTIDTVNTLSVSSAKGDTLRVNDAFTKAYVISDATAAPEIFEYDIPVS